MISLNTVIQWDNGSEVEQLERVLWVDHKQDIVVLFPLTYEKKRKKNKQEQGGIQLNKSDSMPRIDSLSDLQEAIATGAAYKRSVHPFVLIVNEKSPKYATDVKKRDEAYESIKAIVTDEPDCYNPELRSVLIADAMKQFATSKVTIYKRIQKYWKYGKTVKALHPLDHLKGAPGSSRVIEDEGSKPHIKRGRMRAISKIDPSMKGINIDQTAKNNILKTIKEFYLVKKPTPSLVDVHQALLDRFYSVGTKINAKGNEVPIHDPEGRYPSLGQYKYWHYKLCKELGIAEVTRKRIGVRNYNLKNRPVLKSSSEDGKLGPGTVYQVDATVFPTHLVNEFDRSIKIGKAHLFIVKDVYARKIVGKHLGKEQGWEGLKFALFDSFINHGDNDDQDIPALEKTCLLPKCIVWDRGPEMIGNRSDMMSEKLNVNLVNTPPYSADLKGVIEQEFNQLIQRMRHVPGLVRKGPKERGEKDHREEACFTIAELEEEINEQIEWHNRHNCIDSYPYSETMMYEQVQAYPIELWDWGIKQGKAEFNERPSREVMMELFSHGKARVTHEGIKFDRKHYECERGHSEGWFVRTGSHYKTWEVPVLYDSSNACIYLLLDDGRQIEECTLLPKDGKFAKFRREDTEVYYKQQAAKKSARESDRYQSIAERNANSEARIKNAQEKTKADNERSGKSKTAQMKDIKENGKREKEERQSDLISKQLHDIAPEYIQQSDSRFVNDSDDDDDFEPVVSLRAGLYEKLKQAKGG